MRDEFTVHPMHDLMHRLWQSRDAGWRLYCVTYSKWIAAEAMWKQRVAPASDAVLDCFMHAGCHSLRGPAASVSMS